MKQSGNQGLDGAPAVLSQMDELAGYEYLRHCQRRVSLEPEKRLALAVLEDGIYCYQRFFNARGRREKKLHDDAAGWIFQSKDERIFGFDLVCHFLGLDPDYLRLGLKKWSEGNRSRAARQPRSGTRPMGLSRNDRWAKPVRIGRR